MIMNNNNELGVLTQVLKVNSILQETAVAAAEMLRRSCDSFEISCC